MKLSGRAFLILLALVGLAIVVISDRMLPASSDYQAQVRLWLAARATGMVALVLLAAVVVSGVGLSHPEQARLKQAKRVFPWHESLWVFVLAFIGVHIVTLVLDSYADVGLAGAFIPGLATYRSIPVALGTVTFYALLITGLTARWTRLLPAGAWLKIHRVSTVVLGLAWIHGVLAGTDSTSLAPLYWALAATVVGVSATRYWAVRRSAASRRAAATTPVPARATSAPARGVSTNRSEEHHVDPHPAA
jgi:predicted ferric reductase